MEHCFSKLLQIFLISHRESEFLKEWFCSTKLAFLCVLLKLWVLLKYLPRRSPLAPQ